MTDLVNTISFTHGGTATMTTTKSYDTLDRLTSISSATASGVVSGFGYEYSLANQRTSMTVATDGTHWEYGYDTLGQVTSANRYWGSGQSSPVGGQQFSYAYDSIGNRTSTVTNGRKAGYSANLLNQYTSRDVPGTTDIIGTAAADAKKRCSSGK